MARFFCIVSLALAAVSTVSGHVIRRHKQPSGWETDILQNYDQYHERYLKWGCQEQHNTEFFDQCCHPLLKGESMSVLENLGCNDGCEDDGDPSVLPSSTSSSSSQPAYTYTSSSASYSPSSKPASGALAKGDDSTPPSSSPTTSTPTPTPPKPSTSPSPTQTSSSGGGGGGEVYTGGEGTFFYQNGVAGACGAVHQDSDLICAIDSQRYSQSICGKSVQITNTDNGKSVTVVVADECPTCKNGNSVDLSTGAFQQIGDESQGVLNIKWEFV